MKSLILIGLAFAALPAAAATRVVRPDAATTTDTTDYSTIQAALNAAASGDTISVMPGTYTGAIRFRGKQVSLSSTAGAATTIIVGNGRDPVISVIDGEGSGVSISGFTLRNTNARGLRTLGTSPTISNLTLQNLGSSSLNGGAMHLSGGSPTLSNLTFASNTGSYGGHLAITDGASVTLSSSTFSGGTALRGGAISLAASTLNATGLTFSSNSATDWGGGLRLSQNSTVTLSDSTFSGNVASNQQGGGISSAGQSILTLTNVDFFDNEAPYGGGGIYFENGTLSVTGSTFDTNLATITDGGAVLLGLAGTMSFSGCSFLDNQAEGDGGGLAITDGTQVALYPDITVSVSDSTFDGNSAGDSGGGLSGIIYTLPASLDMEGVTFSNNTANNGVDAMGGGGFYVDSFTSLSLIDVLSHTNTSVSEGGGGGSIATVGTVDIDLSTFANNTAGEAGGIDARFMDVGSTFSLNESLVQDNYAVSCGAGRVETGGSISVVNNVFLDNEASIYGFCLTTTQATFTNNVVAHNTTTSGGAIHVSVAGTTSGITISYSDWYNNTAKSLSGSINPSVLNRNGNIKTNPTFTTFSDDGNWANDDLHPGSGSPLIDAGTPTGTDIGMYP